MYRRLVVFLFQTIAAEASLMYLEVSRWQVCAIYEICCQQE